jgi:hypothetical protein
MGILLGSLYLFHASTFKAVFQFRVVRLEPNSFSRTAILITPFPGVPLPLKRRRSGNCFSSPVTWAVYLSSFTCRVIFGPASAFDTGQFFFAASACFCRSSSLRFGTWTCVFNSINVIVGPSPR